MAKKINEMSSAGMGAAEVGGGTPFGVKKVKRKHKKNIGAPFNNSLKETTVEMPISPFGVVIPKNNKAKKESERQQDLGGGKEPRAVKVGIGDPGNVKDAIEDTEKVPKNKNIKLVVQESRQEKLLRESIRNLVFLNRIKYHEEQVRRELQEQKIRKVIRSLLREDIDLSNLPSSTGEGLGRDFLDNMTVTLQTLANQTSSPDQRRQYVELYIMILQNHFDLRKKLMALKTSSGQANVPANTQQGMPELGAAPAKRGDNFGDLEEQDPEPTPNADPAPVSAAPAPASAGNMLSPKDVQAATLKTAEQVAMKQFDAAIVKTVIDQLKRDLSVLDNAIDKASTQSIVVNGRQTTDLDELELYLLGDKDGSRLGKTTQGNIQIRADDINKTVDIVKGESGAGAGAENTPPPVTPPEIGAEAPETSTEEVPELETPPAKRSEKKKPKPYKYV